MKKNLNQRIEETFSALNSDGRKLVGELRECFNEYFLGANIVPHSDMVSLIQESKLDREQANLVMDYSFLNCAQHALPGAVGKFVSIYPDYKYNPVYSLPNHLLLWDDSNNRFAEGDELGTYSPLVVGLVNHLERTKELKGYIYSDDTEFLMNLTGFRKIGLISVLAYNSELIAGIILGSLEDKLRNETEDIISDRRLAREAAAAFIEAFGKHRDNPHYKKGLGNFLDRYDITKEDFVKKRAGGQYRELYKRLVKRHGALFRRNFVELLDEPLKSRVDMLTQELGNKRILEEDRIRLLERLAREDLLKYLDLFADDGSDAGDILLAARFGQLSETEKKLLCDITSRGKVSLAKYLGVCKMPIADTALKYDARRCLGELCQRMDSSSLQNEILESVLLNKIKEQYYDRFVRAPQETIDSLIEEVNGETNEVRRMLLEKTIEHFRLRQKVKKVRGLKDKIVVIS